MLRKLPQATVPCSSGGWRRGNEPTMMEMPVQRKVFAGHANCCNGLLECVLFSSTSDHGPSSEVRPTTKKAAKPIKDTWHN